MRKKNGFSLIELLAVIAILAILALISIPMVQDYVDKAEEKAKDVNIRNLLRAADNYYSYINMEMGTEYPVVLDLPSNEIKLTGGQPDFGQIIIYEDGSIYVEAVYGEDIYIKQPEDVNAEKGNVVIGDYLVWQTDGNGTITRYNLNAIVKNQLNFIEEMIMTSIDYASRGGEYELDYSISLKENYDKILAKIEVEILLETINRMPEKIETEIEYMLEKFNTSSAITDTTTLISMFSDDNNLSYMWEVVSIMTGEIDLNESTIYAFLITEADNDTVTIPNYVKGPTGNLEKITTIGERAFMVDDTINNLINCTIAPDNATDKGKDVIISHGIEVVGQYAFVGCLIENVKLPSTLKRIEASAFSYNRLTTLDLPSKLEYLDGFAINDLKGEIVIPKSVTEIGTGSFVSDVIEQDSSWCTSEYEHLVKLCEGMQGIENKITKVTFEKGSKIETIGGNAFEDNLITTVTIPGSIKEIEIDAFNCSTLTSAHIERAQGDDLTVEETAFGSIIPTYEN